MDGATNLSFHAGGATYDAVDGTGIVHPKWNGDILKGDDFGLVPLGSSVAGITPAQRYAGSDILGQVGTSIGFGVTGTGLTGGTIFDGNKRAGENIIDVWLRIRGKERAVFLKDFDNPLNAGDSRYGRSTPLDL